MDETTQAGAGHRHKSVFPAPIYRETVLKPIFENAKRYFLAPLIEIDCAHTLMLARQQIMPRQEAASVLRALETLDRSEICNAEYDGSFEDLYFLLAKVLILFANVPGQPHHSTFACKPSERVELCCNWEFMDTL